MTVAGRAIVIAAWIAALAALTTWEDSDSATWVAVAATVVAGGLIGRRWVVIATLIFGGVVALLILLSGASPDSDGMTAAEWGVATFVVALILAGLLAVGVSARGLVDHVSGRLTRRHGSRSDTH